MVAHLIPEPAARGPRPVLRPMEARPVKVGFISPLGYGLYRPESGVPFGGAEVQFFLLARALSADPTFQVSVLTTVPADAGTEQHGALTLVKRMGQNRLSSDGKGSLPGCWSAFLDMRRTLQAIDADVYCHAGAGVEVGAYAMICRLLRRRFVFVVASSEDLTGDRRLVRGPLQSLYPLGLRLADAVVCRSEEQQAALRSRYRRGGLLIRTGHPVPAQAAPSGAGKSTVLWVGRMHPLKQPGLFLELAQRLPKERFVMVAFRDRAHESLRRTVRERVSGLDNVTLHEDVPWHQVGRFFEAAKLVVNTSTYEGFPNTFVQAALQATPVLSWAVDPDQVLTRHRIGFSAAGSFERLASAAEELSASELLRAELGRRARRYAEQHHDLERSADEWRFLLRRLAGRGAG